MMNWMFTWLQPRGALSHADLAPVVADLFFGGIGAVRTPAAARRDASAQTTADASGASSRRQRRRRGGGPVRRRRARPRRVRPNPERAFHACPAKPDRRSLDRQPRRRARSPAPSTARTIHHAHADEIDFAEALAFARRTRRPGAARARLPAARGAAEGARRLPQRAQGSSSTRSRATPARRAATAGSTSKAAPARSTPTPRWAATSCRRATSCTKGRRSMLGKKGQFAATHILVPRGGVAVHINAFNFPVWGLLEKFAPTFLAGMPCIAKPATATSYLTEALVRLMVGSGLLPEGSLQLVIGSTGDLLDRLESSDVVTFTGSADTALKLRRQREPARALGSVHRRGRFAQRRDPRSRRLSRRRGVRPVREGGRARDDGQGGAEVHRDPARDRAARVISMRWPRGCAIGSPRSASAIRRSRA